ncbi:hypothetical protein Ddc_22952 [Ditylenchus destructor]|nr:hypothetical protein Ddc_22952 [Ditylenchus destructor]
MHWISTATGGAASSRSILSIHVHQSRVRKGCLAARVDFGSGARWVASPKTSTSSRPTSTTISGRVTGCWKQPSRGGMRTPWKRPGR